MNANTVGQWHSQRKAMEVDRIITRALRGGTTAMRSMGTVLTPMDHRERRQPKEYMARLLRTFLFPAYDDAITGIVDKPFQRAIQLKEAETLPPNMQLLEWDCDREGTNLTQMGRQLMDSLADTGLAILLVDKPSAYVRLEDGTARPMNLAEEEAADVRPYFVFVHPDSVINWSWRRDATGKRILAGIAIYSESHEVDPQSMEERTVQQVLAWTEESFEMWERVMPSSIAGLSPSVDTQGDLLITSKQSSTATSATDRDPYVLVAQGPNPLGRVPVVFRNVSRRGGDPLVAKPPLIDLAWKNVDDWLVTSSLSNNLHWHSYPALSISGASADLADGTADVTYGAGATIISRDPQMQVGFVETSGAAAQKLMERLAGIRTEEQSLGLAPFLEQVSAGSTATAVDAAGARAQSRVQSWTEQLEWLLYDAFAMAMLWETAGRDDTLPEAFDVDIFRDFGIPTRAQTDLQTLAAARQAREITQATFLRELQKRGTLGDEVDIEREVVETGAEAPALGQLLPFGTQPQQAEDDITPDEDAQTDEAGSDSV